MPHARKIIPSPVGPLTLVASAAGLAAILWENERPDRVRVGALVDEPGHPLLCRAEAQLGEYFAGFRTTFDIPLDLVGTAFQQKVWAALQRIPFGETRSYGALAAEVGTPKASRAVGAANGRNPVSIMVPCHRAIGADGSLTGFAGGIETKRFLLALEAQKDWTLI